MTGNALRLVRLCVWFCLLGALGLFATGCGTNVIPYLPETTVANLPSEDLAGPCTYAIRVAQGPATPGLPPTQIPQTAVLVVFERSDSLKLFDDEAVIAEAQKLHMAMLYAYQCDAASFNDLQPLATAGPGRALFQALNQFSQSLGHPELATANVFLTGFSAAGYLSVSTASAYPNRVLGTIPYAPASSFYDVGSFAVSPALAKIPSLILVSATDIAAGDQRPLFLFEEGRAQGAPWAFGSQHALNHCCVDSIESVLVPWVDSIFTQDTTVASNGLVSLQPLQGAALPKVAFQITPDGSFDPFGWQDFTLGDPVISSVYSATSPYQGWLPDQTTAQAWLTWVTNPNGN